MIVWIVRTEYRGSSLERSELALKSGLGIPTGYLIESSW